MNILKDQYQIIVTRPLEISEVATNYDVKCSVKGGGLSDKRSYYFRNFKSSNIFDENLKKNLKR